MTRYVSTDWWSVWILFGKYVWVAGMAAMLICSAVSYEKIKKKTRIAIPLRENIFIADDIKSPFVIGFIRPKIYLPCNLEEKEQQYIILHEQHHIRRFDHVIKALAFLALTVHWFNPLVWIAFVLACKDMEMSCDEAVIRKLGSDLRADYSASLLTLATGHRMIAGTPLAFGEGDTKGRIKNLAKWKKPAVWLLVLLLILCLVLGVCLLTDRVSRQNDHVGTTFYCGNVTEQTADGNTPRIHVLCNDGTQRVFYYEAGNADIPVDLIGKQVKVRARIQELTGNLFTTQITQVPDAWFDNLDDAIQNAILSHHRYETNPEGLECASFFSYSSEVSNPADRNQAKLVTEYGITYHQNYRLENGRLIEGGGCNVPTVLTFRVNDDGQYILAEYWEPRDGSYYPEDIKAKYPSFVWPDETKNLFEQKLAVFKQAMEGFLVGPEVVVDHLITDICDRSQWANGLENLMQLCSLQRELLSYYGSDTLRYCFGAFLYKEENDLEARVMAYVCGEIMDSLGEPLPENLLQPQQGKSWFETYCEHAVALLDHYSYDEIAEKYPASWILLSEMGRIPASADWGITLSAENVTAEGLTIICAQSGWYPTGDLIYGSPYQLQMFSKGLWIPVKPIVDEMVWTSEAYRMPVNGKVEIPINWTSRYGTLQPGIYRIGKVFSDHRAPGYSDYAVLYAEFTVE